MKKLLSTIAILLMVRIFLTAGTPPTQAPAIYKFASTDYYQIYNSLSMFFPGDVPTRQPYVYNFQNTDLYQVYNAVCRLDSAIRVDTAHGIGNRLYVETSGQGSTVAPIYGGTDFETWAGYQAGNNETKSNTVSIGHQAGQNATTATSLVAIGFQAALNDTFSAQSVMVGPLAGYSAPHTDYSTFTGYDAGGNAINAYHSVFNGALAGSIAQNSNNAVFVGYGAGGSDTAAAFGTMLGNQAGFHSPNASYSTFMGNLAGSLSRNLSNSICVGSWSGVAAVNAANSIFIGDHAGYLDAVNNTGPGSYHSILFGDSTGTGGYHNSIAFGTGAVNTDSNQLLVSGIYTKLQLALNSPVAPGSVLTNVDGAGNAAWQTPSGSVGPTGATGPTGNDGVAGATGATGAGGGLFFVNTNGDTIHTAAGDSLFMAGHSHNKPVGGGGIFLNKPLTGPTVGVFDMSQIGASSKSAIFGYADLPNHIINIVVADTGSVSILASNQITIGGFVFPNTGNIRPDSGTLMSVVPAMNGNDSLIFIDPPKSWMLGGNNNTNGVTDYLGITGNKPLLIAANDTVYEKITSAIIGQTGSVAFGYNLDHTTPVTHGEIVQIQGSIAIIDGTQGAGKTLTSNSYGTATWQAPGNYPAYPNNAAAVAVLGTLKLYVTDGTDPTVAGGLKGLVMQTY